MNIQLRTILLGLLSIGFAQGYAQTFALQVKDDRITYLNDEQGNRILDFSYCGYKAPNKIFLLSAMPCLYLGQQEIIHHVFNAPLTMSLH